MFEKWKFAIKFEKISQTESVVGNIRTLIYKKCVNFWLEISKLSCHGSLFELDMMVLILVRRKHMPNIIVTTEFVMMSIMKLYKDQLHEVVLK